MTLAKFSQFHISYSVCVSDAYFFTSGWSKVCHDHVYSETCVQRKAVVSNLSGSTVLRTAREILVRDLGTAAALTTMFRISTPSPNHYKINERAKRSPPCNFPVLELLCVCFSETLLCILLPTL